MTGLMENINMTHPEFIDEIVEKKVLSDDLIKAMKAAMTDYVTQFQRLQEKG